MSEQQGHIVKDQDASGQGHNSDFDARDFYGNDRNDAGDADATGGDNQGDINLNIEQGGDAYARGGDVTTYESYEHHTYTQYQEPEYHEHGHEHGHEEHGKYDDSGKYEEHDHGCEDSHDSADNIF
jgi:hypothetical protein